MEKTGKSIVGPSLVIKGRVTARNQALKVQGRIEGELDLDDILIVEDQGVIEASLMCREAHIAGQVSGNIYATEKAVIEPKGRVTGALFAPVFSVSEGARLDGSVEMDAQDGALEKKFRLAAGQPAQPKQSRPAKKTKKDDAERKQISDEVSTSTANAGSAETKG